MMDLRLLAGLLAGLLLLATGAPCAQAENPADAPIASNKLSLEAFLAEVAENNLEYAAQRYNVSIAQAQIAKARVYRNPTLGTGAWKDVSGQDMPSLFNLGITQTFLTGGKRRAGIEVAERNHRVAGATLEDFFRNLRAAAASAFVDALAAQLIVEQKRRSAASLDKLVEANERRFRAGDLAEIDVIQSRVEALRFQGELLAAQSTLQTALIALSQFLGLERSSVTVTPLGRLEIPGKTFVLSELVEEALQKRADVVAAFQNREAARAGIKLAEANRIPDVDIGFGWQRSTSSNNEIAPSPQFDLLGLSLSVPIPVFNTLRAELNMARFAREQAEKNWQAARLKAEVEVRQAHARYQLAVQRVAKYREGALRDSATVLEGKLYSFHRGRASLLEVLNAQREENNIYLAYYDTLTEYAKALVALEQAAGIWDVSF
jgi:cobalt-zinc-cadmium efflux system outer membrane protein